MSALLPMFSLSNLSFISYSYFLCHTLFSSTFCSICPLHQRGEWIFKINPLFLLWLVSNASNQNWELCLWPWSDLFGFRKHEWIIKSLSSPSFFLTVQEYGSFSCMRITYLHICCCCQTFFVVAVCLSPLILHTGAKSVCVCVLLCVSVVCFVQ